MGNHHDRDVAGGPAHQHGDPSPEDETEVEDAAEKEAPEDRPTEQGQRHPQDVQRLEHRRQEGFRAGRRREAPELTQVGALRRRSVVSQRSGGQLRLQRGIDDDGDRPLGDVAPGIGDRVGDHGRAQPAVRRMEHDEPIGHVDLPDTGGTDRHEGQLSALRVVVVAEGVQRQAP